MNNSSFRNNTQIAIFWGMLVLELSIFFGLSKAIPQFAWLFFIAMAAAFMMWIAMYWWICSDEAEPR